jgi:prepilin-type N-terminal cleavage/methylation domain-containing protein
MRFKNKAFTLIEIVIAVALIAIIIGLGTVALRSAKITSENNAALGNAKTLNEARERVLINGIGGISSAEDWNNTFGTNGVAAAEFLLDNGLIRVP